MSLPVVLHDTVFHYGHSLRARILCDIWMYTSTYVLISRGDTVTQVKNREPVYYEVTDVLVSNAAYQKFRVAKRSPVL